MGSETEKAKERAETKVEWATKKAKHMEMVN
jgi:hypothetical protein